MGHLTIIETELRYDTMYVVRVHDERGQLICWCGPYKPHDRDNCVTTFVMAGWSVRRN